MRISEAPQPNLGIIPEHNGIRGLGASIVIAGHVFTSWHFVLAPVLMDLFFIYSAFFVTRIFLNTKLSWPNIKIFYVRRAIRIWPLYYAITLPCLVLEQLLAGANIGLIPRHSLADWLQFLSFFQFTPAYFERYADNPEYLLGHTWSIAIEEQFYLTWPLLLALLIRSPRWALPVLVGVGLLAPLSNLNGIASHLYLTRLDDFALGTASAWLAHRTNWRLLGQSFRSEQVLLGTAAGSFLICVALSIGILLAVPIDAPPSTIVGYNDNHAVCFIYKVFFATMIPAVSTTASLPIWAWLRFSPLVFLGSLAYPLYLVHYPALLITARLTNSAWGWTRATSGLIGVPLAVALAYLCYRCIEVPAERRRQLYRYIQGPAAFN